MSLKNKYQSMSFNDMTFSYLRYDFVKHLKVTRFVKCTSRVEEKRDKYFRYSGISFSSEDRFHVQHSFLIETWNQKIYKICKFSLLICR